MAPNSGKVFAAGKFAGGDTGYKMASTLPLFPSAGISERAVQVGFRFGAKGTHTSRTMMFDELAAVLAAAPETASRAMPWPAAATSRCAATCW